MEDLRVSLIMAVWNTAHLLKRTLHTLTQQTYENFETIIIDDCSEDDVEEVVQPYYDVLDIKVHRLEHSLGMRGNTVSFNTGFSLAQGEILMENTPEIMLYPECIQDMVEALIDLGSKSWVSIRTYNLVPEDQLVIDQIDWRSDVRALESLPNFASPWTQNNTKQDYFGTHQTCVMFREDWFKYWVRYPFFLDYGTDDPWNSGVREDRGIQSATISPFVYHTWHAPINFWMAYNKAPNWNRWGHTMKNLYNDPAVPEGGTAEWWDTKEGSDPCEMQSEEDKENWKGWTQTVIDTGFRRKDGKSICGS